jgi:hypothetical protein
MGSRACEGEGLGKLVCAKSERHKHWNQFDDVCKKTFGGAAHSPTDVARCTSGDRSSSTVRVIGRERLTRVSTTISNTLSFHHTPSSRPMLGGAVNTPASRPSVIPVTRSFYSRLATTIANKQTNMKNKQTKGEDVMHCVSWDASWMKSWGAKMTQQAAQWQW